MIRKAFLLQLTDLVPPNVNNACDPYGGTLVIDPEINVIIPDSDFPNTQITPGVFIQYYNTPWIPFKRLNALFEFILQAQGSAGCAKFSCDVQDDLTDVLLRFGCDNGLVMFRHIRSQFPV